MKAVQPATCVCLFIGLLVYHVFPHYILADQFECFHIDILLLLLLILGIVSLSLASNKV